MATRSRVRVRVSCPPPINRSMTIRTVVLGVPFRAELICAGSQPFDREDLVADADAGSVGRGAFVGLCENYVIAFLADHRTDASVLARGEQVEVRHLLFGQKFGVGVEVASHAFGGILHQLVGIDFIDVEERKLPHHIDQ